MTIKLKCYHIMPYFDENVIFTDFSDRLWQYFETFQKLSLTFSPPTQLSDILVLYTHMAKYL